MERIPRLTVPPCQPHYRAVYERCASAIRLLALAFLVVGCAGLKSDYDIAKERAQIYVAVHPDLPSNTAEAIRTNTIQNGMTMEQVIAAWGPPAVVEKFREGTLQYWFFGCDRPHFCKSQNRVRSGPEEIYHSRALFQDGVVADWGS